MLVLVKKCLNQLIKVFRLIGNFHAGVFELVCAEDSVMPRMDQFIMNNVKMSFCVLFSYFSIKPTYV